MKVWRGSGGLGLLMALLLAGCQLQPKGETTGPDEAPVDSASAASPDAPSPAATPEVEPAAPSAPAAAPAAEAPPAPAPAAQPVTSAKTLEGMQLNPKDGVQILLPDGWEQTTSDDGALLQMVRRGLIGGVRVTVTLDYAVDQKAGPHVDLSAIEADFVAQMKDILKDQKFAVVATRHVTVAGFPALAIGGNLEDQGQAFRLKQYLILQGETFWTLSVIGPQSEFEAQVEPEFDAIAATLEIS